VSDKSSNRFFLLKTNKNIAKIFQTRNLTKHFGTFSAVEDVSLAIDKGEI